MSENHVSWKKTDELEVNLFELLQRLCRQWKQIAVCAVVFACLIGGYKMMSGRKTVSMTEQVNTAQEALTVNEQQRVAAAVELSEGIQKQESYLSESVLINIDSSKKDRFSLIYSVEKAKKHDRQKIVEAYMNYLGSGELADRIQKSNQSLQDMDSAYITELIAVSQKNNGSQIVIEETADNVIFQITIAGRDAGMVEALSAGVQEGISDYQSSAQSEAGAHELKLVSAQQSVVADNDLAVRQNEKRAQLSTAVQNLKTITDTFSEQQKLVYNDKLEADSDKSTEKKAEETVVSGGISIKWIGIGLFSGIAVYCLIFICCYLLKGTVKSVDELKRQYIFPVFGGITLKKGSSGSGEDLSGKEKDTYERERAQLLNRIRLACKTQETEKFCLATDFSFSEQDRGLLTTVQKQLQDWGIEVILAENAAGNVAVWDKLTETGAVFMLCKLDVTTHKVIDEEMQFYLENGLQVLGAAVLECR